MKKTDIIKLSGDFSKLNKILKLSSVVTKSAKLLVAAVLIFTAVDTFFTLKKA